jgi:hypothetical protein
LGCPPEAAQGILDFVGKASHQFSGRFLNALLLGLTIHAQHAVHGQQLEEKNLAVALRERSHGEVDGNVLVLGSRDQFYLAARIALTAI